MISKRRVYEDCTVDLCPVCLTTPLTGCGLWTDVGEVCSIHCESEHRRQLLAERWYRGTPAEHHHRFLKELVEESTE